MQIWFLDCKGRVSKALKLFLPATLVFFHSLRRQPSEASVPSISNAVKYRTRLEVISRTDFLPILRRLQLREESLSRIKHTFSSQRPVYRPALSKPPRSIFAKMYATSQCILTAPSKSARGVFPALCLLHDGCGTCSIRPPGVVLPYSQPCSCVKYCQILSDFLLRSASFHALSVIDTCSCGPNA